MEKDLELRRVSHTIDDDRLVALLHGRRVEVHETFLVPHASVCARVNAVDFPYLQHSRAADGAAESNLMRSRTRS